jgi:hypothetical protein
MSQTAFCPHCGKPDAPTWVNEGVRVIDRHRRLDWNPKTSPGNEICLGGGLAVGERCGHLVPNDLCFSAPDAAITVYVTDVDSGSEG